MVFYYLRIEFVSHAFLLFAISYFQKVMTLPSKDILDFLLLTTVSLLPSIGLPCMPIANGSVRLVTFVNVTKHQPKNQLDSFNLYPSHPSAGPL